MCKFVISLHLQHNSDAKMSYYDNSISCLYYNYHLFSTPSIPARAARTHPLRPPSSTRPSILPKGYPPLRLPWRGGASQEQVGSIGHQSFCNSVLVYIIFFNNLNGMITGVWRKFIISANIKLWGNLYRKVIYKGETITLQDSQKHNNKYYSLGIEYT